MHFSVLSSEMYELYEGDPSLGGYARVNGFSFFSLRFFFGNSARQRLVTINHEQLLYLRNWRDNA